MTYHDLTKESGSTADSRRAEADRLCTMIEDNLEQLTPTELSFLGQVQDGGPVSTKQLFWLRDIKDKY